MKLLIVCDQLPKFTDIQFSINKTKESCISSKITSRDWKMLVSSAQYNTLTIYRLAKYLPKKSCWFNNWLIISAGDIDDANINTKNLTHINTDFSYVQHDLHLHVMHPVEDKSNANQICINTDPFWKTQQSTTGDIAFSIQLHNPSNSMKLLDGFNRCRHIKYILGAIV